MHIQNATGKDTKILPEFCWISNGFYWKGYKRSTGNLLEREVIQ